MRTFFGMFALLFVAGSIVLAYVVFTPGSELVLAVLAGLAISIGAEGMRAGWKS